MEPNSLDEHLYVHTKAFVFQPSDCNDVATGRPCHANHLGHGSTADPDILTAAIIYNLGLGHHILGIRPNSSSFQQRSIALYELSMGLLQTIMEAHEKGQGRRILRAG